MLADQALHCGDERGDRGLHVGGAAPVQIAVALDRLEGIGLPLLERPGGHDIGVAGEANHGRAAAAPCPQIVHRAEAHRFDAEAERLQAGSQDLLAASVIGGDGAAADQRFGERQGGAGCGIVRHGPGL